MRPLPSARETERVRQNYGRVKLTAPFPIITQQSSKSKFARLGLAKRTRTSGAEGLLTSLVSLVAGHAGVAFPTLADLASWLSPHVTEIFGDYPHEWGLRNHFGDGTIRPPGHMSRTFLQPGGAYGARSLSHALLYRQFQL